MESGWVNVVETTYQGMWTKTVSLVPELITALLVIIAGWIVARILKRVIVTIAQKIKIDDALRMTGVHTLFEKGGYTLKTGAVVGALVWWFIMLVAVIAALDILGLSEVTTFLSDVILGYLPKVIVAVLILFGGLVLAGVVERAIVAGGRTVSFGSAHFLGKAAKYAIVVFSILAVFNQLEIAAELVQMLFAGIVFAVSLALGLSFGLGGRDAARDYIDGMKKGSGSHGHHGG